MKSLYSNYGIKYVILLLIVMAFAACNQQSNNQELFSISAQENGSVEIQTNNYQLALTSEEIKLDLGTEIVSMQFENASQVSPQTKEKEVHYQEIYPNTNLRLYEKAGNAAYDFILQPKANVQDICLQLNQASASIDKAGDLILPFKEGVVKHSKPYSYQEIDGQKVEVESQFLLADNCLSFELGDYDPSYAVVIDPTISMMMVSADVPLFEYWTGDGNYDVVSNGVSFFTQNTTGSFTLDVPACSGSPATVVKAYLSWMHRDFLDETTTLPVGGNQDMSVDFNFNGTTTAVTQDEVWLASIEGRPAPDARPDAEYYHVLADVTTEVAAGLLGGTNNITVSGVDAGPGDVQTYGVSLTVIYECASLPYVKSSFFGGNDFFLCTRDQMVAGPYSSPLSITFPADASSRSAKYVTVFGGQANASAPFRGGNVGIITGTGTPPTDNAMPPAGTVYNTAGAAYTPNPTWTSSLGQEWDRFESTVTIPAGDTYISMQGSSVAAAGTAGCGSLNMLGIAFTVPIAPPPSNTTCDCVDYIYLNEIASGLGGGGIVHKFAVDPMNGSVAEIMNGAALDQPWYPGDNATELPSPHGLGVDLNGNLYIGENFVGDPDIRRLDCAGNITPNLTQDPVNGFEINSSNNLFNISSFDGLIYSNGNGARIYRWDPCDGSAQGFVNLSGNIGNDWGFYIDQNTGIFYATDDGGNIWKFSPTDNDFTTNAGFTPFITPNAGSFGLNNNFTSGINLQGITTDNAENIYVVEGNRDAINTNSRILKFNAAGSLIAIGPTDNDGGNGAGWNQMVGIVYSADANRLYTSSLNQNEDCLSSWDVDLTTGTQEIGPAGTGRAKGLAILRECCPSVTPTVVNESVCYSGTPEKVFLQDIVNCGGNGIICEGDWMADGGNPAFFSYDACDSSVEITGNGCGTFTLSKGAQTGAQQCAAFTVTVNICTTAPPTSDPTVALPGSCTGLTPNNDASITIPNIMDADVVGISTAGSTFIMVLLMMLWLQQQTYK